MPEGPEIKLAADKIARAIVDRSLTEVSFALDRLKSFEAELSAARIVSVTPKGKALLTRFSNQLTIYSHNQLYGVWYSRRAYDYPTTNRQLRLAIHTEKRSALLYSASDIDVLDKTSGLFDKSAPETSRRPPGTAAPILRHQGDYK